MAHHAREAGFLQTLERAAGDAAAGFAVGVADIVKEPPAALEYAVEFAIEKAGIEFAGQAKGRGIVDHAVKALAGQSWHDLVGIAHELRDSGMGKEFLRPGILVRDGLRAWIKLDRRHGPRAPGGQNGGLAQAGRGIE